MMSMRDLRWREMLLMKLGRLRNSSKKLTKDILTLSDLNSGMVAFYLVIIKLTIKSEEFVAIYT